MKFLIEGCLSPTELAGAADLVNQALEISLLENGEFDIARYDLRAA